MEVRETFLKLQPSGVSGELVTTANPFHNMEKPGKETKAGYN